MRRSRNVSIALVCLGWVAVGCGGSASGGGGSTSGGAPVSVNDFAARFGSVLCSSMADCCTSHDFKYDSATCNAGLSSTFRSLVLRNQGLSVTYDAAAAGRCLDDYAKLLEGCGAISTKDRDSDCHKMFVGTVQTGGACKDSTECAAGTGGDDYCSGGVCVVGSTINRTRGALNAPCAATCTEAPGSSSCSGGGGTGDSCYTNDGLYCDPTGKCGPLPKLGESCGTVCASGAYCDAGQCAPQVDSGSCANNPNTCSDRSYCDFTQHQCLAKKADGAACTSSEDCLAGSCSENKCGVELPVDASFCAGIAN